MRSFVFFYYLISLAFMPGCLCAQESDKISEKPNLTTPIFKIQFDAASLKKLGALYPKGEQFEFIRGYKGHPAVQFFGFDKPGIIQIPNRSELIVQTGVTYDFWVRVNDFVGMNGFGFRKQGNTVIMSTFAKSHDRVGFALVSSKLNDQKNFFPLITFDQTWSQTGCELSNSETDLERMQWHRISVSIDKNQGYHVYIDKRLTTACLNARPNFASANQQDLFFGAFKDGWYPLNGAIQDFQVFSHALSESEIHALPDSLEE